MVIRYKAVLLKLVLFYVFSITRLLLFLLVLLNCVIDKYFACFLAQTLKILFLLPSLHFRKGQLAALADLDM